MTRLSFLVGVCFALLSLQELSAQSSEPARQWLFLRERDHSTLSPSALGISERALRRRAKVLPNNKLVDAYDLPPSPSLIQQIQSSGAKVHSVSRWLNAVSVEATPEQLRTIQAISSVKAIQPVGVLKRRRPIEEPKLRINSSFPLEPQSGSNDYGPSLLQLKNIRVNDVHALRITGAGVIVGMIDDGFNNHRTHPALRNINVIAEYDFIQRDSSTSRRPDENPAQGNHGAYTLSALAGYDPGKLIGAAYGVSVILAKTEIESIEVQMEEDLYVEALEWMERLGADIVSTSLGYIDWYTYADLDGKTAITSKAARVAASKGVLLVTAMGNEGHFRGRSDSTGTLIAPADADSIIAVGATFSDGEIASFSSTGPTFDGRIKPEIVAQGVSVIAASGTTSGYISVSGTSLSTPLVAGVAALVLSAHPELTPMELRERLLKTATPIRDETPRTQFYPNNFYGWGMTNALRALFYPATPPTTFTLHSNFPNPFNKGTTIRFDAPRFEYARLAVYNVLGQHVRTLFEGVCDLAENTVYWDGTNSNGRPVSTGVYFYRLVASSSVLAGKMLFLK